MTGAGDWRTTSAYGCAGAVRDSSAIGAFGSILTMTSLTVARPAWRTDCHLGSRSTWTQHHGLWARDHLSRADLSAMATDTCAKLGQAQASTGAMESEMHACARGRRKLCACMQHGGKACQCSTKVALRVTATAGNSVQLQALVLDTVSLWKYAMQHLPSQSSFSHSFFRIARTL